MELHLARVVLHNSEDANQEIQVDLVVNGSRAQPALVYFGIWLDKQEKLICPFVMNPSGVVDFGTGYSGDDRYYESDIGNVQLAVGQQVRWRSGDIDQTFAVVEVTRLV